jgi:hypothetical protein
MRIVSDGRSQRYSPYPAMPSANNLALTLDSSSNGPRASTGDTPNLVSIQARGTNCVSPVPSPAPRKAYTITQVQPLCISTAPMPQPRGPGCSSPNPPGTAALSYSSQQAALISLSSNAGFIQNTVPGTPPPQGYHQHEPTNTPAVSMASPTKLSPPQIINPKTLQLHGYHQSGPSSQPAALMSLSGNSAFFQNTDHKTIQPHGYHQSRSSSRVSASMNLSSINNTTNPAPPAQGLTEEQRADFLLSSEFETGQKTCFPPLLAPPQEPDLPGYDTWIAGIGVWGGNQDSFMASNLFISPGNPGVIGHGDLLQPATPYPPVFPQNQLGMSMATTGTLFGAAGLVGTAQQGSSMRHSSVPMAMMDPILWKLPTGTLLDPPIPNMQHEHVGNPELAISLASESFPSGNDLGLSILDDFVMQTGTVVNENASVPPSQHDRHQQTSSTDQIDVAMHTHLSRSPRSGLWRGSVHDSQPVLTNMDDWTILGPTISYGEAFQVRPPSSATPEAIASQTVPNQGAEAAGGLVARPIDTSASAMVDALVSAQVAAIVDATVNAAVVATLAGAVGTPADTPSESEPRRTSAQFEKTLTDSSQATTDAADAEEDSLFVSQSRA